MNVTNFFAKSGSYVVVLTVTDRCGASAQAQVIITVIDPKIFVSADSTGIFQDGTLVLNASHELDDGTFLYTMYFGDGVSTKGAIIEHTYLNSGIFTPLITINDGLTNVTMYFPEIKVHNVVPIPNIVVDNITLIEDETVMLFATEMWDTFSDLGHLTYIWDFGDGSSGMGMEINHTFNHNGTYTVVLTVWDGKDTNETQVNIEVRNVAPRAHAGIKKVRDAILGTPVILDASGSTDTISDLSGLNFTWKIGNYTMYGKTITHVFSSAGPFSVVLEVRDDDGAISEDTLTFHVEEALESEDEEGVINPLSWLLVVIIMALGVFLIVLSGKRDGTKSVDIVEVADDAIILSGMIINEIFKPPVETSLKNGGDEEAEILNTPVSGSLSINEMTEKVNDVTSDQ